MDFDNWDLEHGAGVRLLERIPRTSRHRNFQVFKVNNTTARSYKLRATSYELQVTSDKLQETSNLISMVGNG